MNFKTDHQSNFFFVIFKLIKILNWVFKGSYLMTLTILYQSGFTHLNSEKLEVRELIDLNYV